MDKPLITNIILRDNAKQPLPAPLHDEIILRCKTSSHLEFNIVPEDTSGLELILLVNDPLVALIVDTNQANVIAKAVHASCCYYEDLENIDQLLLKLKEDFNRAT